MYRMEKMIRYFSSILLATVCLIVPATLACTCAYTHPQDQFCGADFVIKARVRTQETFNMGTPDNMGHRGIRDQDARYNNEVETEQDWSTVSRPIRRYSMKVIRTFKTSELFKNVSKEYLYTPAFDSHCGVRLTPYTKYLIMGRVLDGVAEIMTCSYQKEWRTVSKRTKRDIYKTFQENCDDCTIETCYHPDCMKQRKRVSGKCHWNPRADPGQCYVNHSACTLRTPSGRSHRCKWAKNKYLEKCLEETRTRRMQEP